MRSKLLSKVGVLAIVFAGFWLAMPVGLNSQQSAMINIDNDDIGGVVTSAKGAEAGVWVIAETNDLPTRFARMVVTDDQGRYVLPDLPQANYNIWVRGYGLVDSPKVRATPGKLLNLKAVSAPNEAAAAQSYPAIYWYSMMKIPEASEFGGKGKIPGKLTQNEYLNLMKSNGCANCHSIGNRSMRTFPSNVPHPYGKFANSQELWFRRIQSGQGGVTMFSTVMKEMGGAPLPYLADWTDRIAKGELPHTKPLRPQGVERNIVVTTWDWLDDKHYLHDLIASDRRFPTVNAYGPLYGSTELSVDGIPVLDPKKNTVTILPTAVRDTDTPLAMEEGPMQASPYWGEERVWTSKVNNHNAMIDRKGRVWLAAAIRGSNNPAFCKKGSDHPSAKAFPVERASRHLSILDPKTNQYTFIDTCFGTHHLQFDANDVLWTSGGGQVLGWFDMKKFDETGDAMGSQGWTPMILDTNGNGKRDDYVEPNQSVDPTKDKRISAPFYAVMPSPADGSIWGSIRTFPHPSAKVYPLERTNRQVTMLDPKTGQYTYFDTCFQTHHLQFGYDANDTLWTSGGGAVVGWINTKLWEETGDIAKAQGWTPLILDTNGNGKRDDYVEPNQPVDPTKDKRIVAGFYAVMPNPVDGSIWGTFRSIPGAVVRIVPGPIHRRPRSLKSTICRYLDLDPRRGHR